MFGQRITIITKEKSAIENATNMFNMLHKSLVEDKLILFDQKKISQQYRPCVTACNNVISLIYTKLNQQQDTSQAPVYNENAIIQFLGLAFDQSSDWNKKIDMKLKDLHFKKHTQRAKEILNRTRSLLKMQTSLNLFCKTESAQKIVPFVQNCINKVADYQREITKISKLIQPDNVLENTMRLKSIEAFITNQETIFNSVISNLTAEVYDVVSKNCSALGNRLRQNITKFVQNQQSNRKRSGYILNQLKGIFTYNGQQGQSTKTNLSKISEFSEKLCDFFRKLKENKVFAEMFYDHQKYNKLTQNILDIYSQTITKIANNSQNTMAQLNKLREDIKQKGQQKSKLSHFPRECFRQLRMQKYPKTLNKATSQTQQIIDRIKSLILLEEQYQRLNIQCANNEEKIKEYQIKLAKLQIKSNESSPQKRQQVHKATTQHYDKHYKQLEQQYRSKISELADLQSRIKEIGGHKELIPKNTFIPGVLIGINAILDQIAAKLQRLNKLQKNFTIQSQFGLSNNSNKILMNENKQLNERIDKLNKQIKGYHLVNESLKSLQKEYSHLKQQLQRKQQQIRQTNSQSISKSQCINNLQNQHLKLLQQDGNNKIDIERLNTQIVRLKQECSQKQNIITRLQNQNKGYVGIIQSKNQDIINISKEIEVLKQPQPTVVVRQSVAQHLQTRIDNLSEQFSRQRNDLQRQIKQFNNNNDKIDKKIQQILNDRYENLDNMAQPIHQDSNETEFSQGTIIEVGGNSDNYYIENNPYSNLSKLQKRIQQEITTRKSKQDQFNQALKQLASQQNEISKLKAEIGVLIKKNQQLACQQREISKLKAENGVLIKKNQQLIASNSILSQQIQVHTQNIQKIVNNEALIKDNQQIIQKLQKEAKDREQKMKQMQQKIQIINNQKKQGVKQSNDLELQNRLVQLANLKNKINDQKKKHAEMIYNLVSLLKQAKQLAIKSNEYTSQSRKQFTQLKDKMEQQFKTVLLTLIEDNNMNIQKIKQANIKTIDNLEKKHKVKLQKQKQDLQQAFQQQKKRIMLQKQGAEMRQQSSEDKGLSIKQLQDKIQSLLQEIQNYKANQQAQKDSKINIYNEKVKLQQQLKDVKQGNKKQEEQIKQKINELKLKQDQLDQITRQYEDLKKNTSKIVHQLSQLEKQKNQLASQAKELLKLQDIKSRQEFLLKYHHFIHGKIQPNLSFILQLSKLFQGKMMENELQHKFTILSHLNKIKAEPLLKTQLLFKYDTINDKSFHRYIDNHSNLLCIAKTAKGIFLAAYYSGLYASIPNRPMAEPGLLMNLNNNQSYVLKTPQPKQTILMKSMVYDDYYLIFGNAEFRIRSQENTIFSNFAVMGGYFNNRGHKIDKFLCEGNERQTLMQSYEIYELFFEQEERERNE